MKRWANNDSTPIRFLDYFYQLLDKSKVNYEMDVEYRSIREKYMVDLYDKSYQFCCFLNKKLFKNNICKHAYIRIRGFLQHIVKENKIDKQESCRILR